MRLVPVSLCLLALVAAASICHAEDAPAVDRKPIEKKTTEAPPAKRAVKAPTVTIEIPEQPKVEDIDEEATHYQAGLIEVAQGSDDPHKVNAFCLNAKGNILVACGQGPGEIRTLDADGKLLGSWSIDVKPEAINVAPDGSVLVGGDGKLFRFAADGRQLATAESPHADAIKSSKAKLREQVIAQMKAQSNNLESQIQVYESIIAQLEAKKKEGKLAAQEEQILESLSASLEPMKKRLAAQPKKEGEEEKLDEEQIEAQLKNMIRNKLRVASVSSDGKHVYVATYALEGYGFCVWRMNPDFSQGEVVVKDLRGCCGQMDVQVCESGIYVAENARHRVACFDPNGDLKVAWGKQDRTGAEGFTSCCNPMNVCFSKTGDVFTAESNTGRIKRFGADGTFKDFIGDVKLVPGCKNVSIAVSPETDRVYMLDITRNHIVIMKKKTGEPEEKEKPAKVSLK